MLGDIVTILSKTNTLIVKKIKDLISLIEKDSEYQVQLEVAVEGEDFDTAVQYIQETLPESMIIKKDTQDAEISISWNWWYYKKSFEKDVEKLLS